MLRPLLRHGLTLQSHPRPGTHEHRRLRSRQHRTTSISPTACAIRSRRMRPAACGCPIPSRPSSTRTRCARGASARLRDWMARGRLWGDRALRPLQPALRHRLAQHVRLFPAQLDPLFLHPGVGTDRPLRISAELPCLDGARHDRRGAALQARLVVGVRPRRRDRRSLRGRDRRPAAIPWRRLDEDRARPLQPSAGACARETRLRGQGLPGRDPGDAGGEDEGGDQVPAGLDGRGGSRGRRGARGDQARDLGERALRHHVSTR